MKLPQYARRDALCALTFVMVAGYGECAPGYIAIERAWREDDGNLHLWCWVEPSSEPALMAAMESVLHPWTGSR